MKTQVYSWRLTRELKSDLERAARIHRVPVSSILDRAVREWMKRSGTCPVDDEEQRRLHAAATGCLGVLAGRNPRRSEQVRKALRDRLGKRYAR